MVDESYLRGKHNEIKKEPIQRGSMINEVKNTLYDGTKIVGA